MRFYWFIILLSIIYNLLNIIPYIIDFIKKAYSGKDESGRRRGEYVESYQIKNRQANLNGWLGGE
jgi:hypothetical protein